MGVMSGSLSEIDEKVMGGAPLLLRREWELTAPRAGSHLALDAEKMDGDMLIFIEVHVAKTGRTDATGHSGSLLGVKCFRSGSVGDFGAVQRFQNFSDGAVAGVVARFDQADGGLGDARQPGEPDLRESEGLPASPDGRAYGEEISHEHIFTMQISSRQCYQRHLLLKGCA